MTGWAQGLSGFSRGVSSGYDLVSRIKDRNRALEAERLFGDTLRTMYSPTPQPTPDAVPMQGSPFNLPTQGRVPGQQGSPFSMPVPSRPAPLPERSMTPTPQMQPGQFPGAMRGGSPPVELTWQKVLSTAAQQLGTSDPRALAGVVDRMLPMMNSQSQVEWREMSARLREQENARKQQQGDARLAQGDRRLALMERQADQLAKYRDATLAQKDQQIAQVAAKDPAVQRQYDATKAAYLQAEQTYRSALKGVSDAEYNGAEDAKMRATAELDRAEQARDQAWTRLETFAKTPAPTTGGPPATRPLRDALKTAGPAQSAPGGPGMQTTPAGEQIITTKTGAKAQIGSTPSPAPRVTGVAPPSAPAEVGATRPAATVTAEPAPSAPSQTYPLPKSKAMMVKGRRYSVRGAVYTWDGTQLVKVKNSGGAK